MSDEFVREQFDTESPAAPLVEEASTAQWKAQFGAAADRISAVGALSGAFMQKVLDKAISLVPSNASAPPTEAVRDWMDRMRSKNPSEVLDEAIETLKLLSAMARDIWERKYKVDTKVYISVVAVLAYVVAPIDLLPEALLGPVGLADDFALIAWFLREFNSEIARYRAWRDNQMFVQSFEE